MRITTSLFLIPACIGRSSTRPAVYARDPLPVGHLGTTQHRSARQNSRCGQVVVAKEGKTLATWPPGVDATAGISSDKDSKDQPLFSPMTLVYNKIRLNPGPWKGVLGCDSPVVGVV